jgi:hypothetical protein
MSPRNPSITEDTEDRFGVRLPVLRVLCGGELASDVAGKLRTSVA